MAAVRLTVALIWVLLPLVTGAPLMLTPLLRAGRIQEAVELSRVTIDGVRMGHAGFFSVPSASRNNTNHLFAWYQPCLEGCTNTTALIHYFNGGPGSPSVLNGGMAQVGQYYVHNGSLVARERCFSWCRRNHCLFIDQPVMTGLSFQTNRTGHANRGDKVEYTATSAQAAEQAYMVLQQFLQLWPDLQQLPYFVEGLSYGGLYVPWMAYTVWQHNRDAAIKVNIKGIAVGDPVMNWPYQYPTVPGALHGMGLLMEDERDKLKRIFENATELQRSGKCWESFLEANRVWNDDGGYSCKPHCEFLFKQMTGSTETENLLLGSEPKEYNTYAKAWLAKHAEQMHYSGSPTQLDPQMSEGGMVYEAMVRSGDYCNASAGLYTMLFLEAGIDVVVYSSNLDPLLGPPSTEAGAPPFPSRSLIPSRER